MGGAADLGVSLAAGGVGGVAIVLVGQPFDFCKIRLVAASEPLSLAQLVRNVARTEGPLAFYRGMSSPLAGAFVLNAALFTSATAARSAMAHADGSPLSLAESVSSAGAILRTISRRRRFG